MIKNNDFKNLIKLNTYFKSKFKFKKNILGTQVMEMMKFGDILI